MLAELWDSQCMLLCVTTAGGWSGTAARLVVNKNKKHRRSPIERNTAGVAMTFKRCSDARLMHRNDLMCVYLRFNAQASMMGSATHHKGMGQ